MSSTVTTSTASELGFSTKQGANWSEYLSFRPPYPPSFFTRIFEYHARNPFVRWSTAHDVGAGCGIVSSGLAGRFERVLVSDPNDGYTTLARRLLVEESGLPEGKFTFTQEGAERSSAGTGTVDLIAACECIQWTETDVAVAEFGRELRQGGTLVITYYTRPRIVGNEKAQNAWTGIWEAYSERSSGAGEWLAKAFPVINTGLETVGFPEEGWEEVQRVYINARGSLEAFTINEHVGESRVKEGEERIWVEGDEDWSDVQGIEWFKGYFATWVPVIPETEIQHFWDELEVSLGGEKVKTETPLVMVFARKA